jgi:hypothetical protein
LVLERARAASEVQAPGEGSLAARKQFAQAAAARWPAGSVPAGLQQLSRAFVAARVVEQEWEKVRLG